MSDTDICFYMAITKEENSTFVPSQPDNSGLVSNLGASFKRRSMKVLNKGAKKEYMFKRTSVADVGIHINKPAGPKPPSSPMKQRTPLLSSEPSDDTKYSSIKVNKPSVIFQNPVEQVKNSKPPSTPTDCKNPAINSNNCSSNITLTYHKSYAKPANLASEENSTSELDVDYDEKEDEDEEDAFSDEEEEDAEEAKDRKANEAPNSKGLYTGIPPITPYIGTSPIHCHLMKSPRPLCCLNLTESCVHCSYVHAHEYKWSNLSVIVAADRSSNALFNFIVPLRSHSRHKEQLHPIVLLLEEKPNLTFLETICHFPAVYWMIGSIDRLDDLFLAGIQIADTVVVVNKESSNAGQEETLADCNTIVAVQSMFRLFPSANIVTELSQASNMRFMQFRARDTYALQLSKLEKKEKERGSQLCFMFRLPFAAGNVFTSSMLDTLLYQAFVKDYVIKFVRLLLGIDQEAGSGYLACIQLSEENLSVGTYGLLYQKLCSTTHQIPIGIYRTISQKYAASYSNCEDIPGTDELEIMQMIRCRLVSLGLPPKQPETLSCDRESISYVVLNPEYDMELDKNDIIYAINPFSLSPEVTAAMAQKT